MTGLVFLFGNYHQHQHYIIACKRGRNMMKKKQTTMSLKHYICAILPWTVILRKMKNIRYFSQLHHFTVVTYTCMHTHIYVCMIASPKKVWCHMPLESIWNIFFLLPLIRVLAGILICLSSIWASASQSASQLMTGRIWGYHIASLSASLKHLKLGQEVNTLSCLYDFTQYQAVASILSQSKISTLISIIARIGDCYTADRYYSLGHKVSHWACKRKMF